MLRRKKKYYQDISFVVDILAGLVILQGLYVGLFHWSEELETFLRMVTAYPFNLQGMEHLDNNGWLFPVILLCLLLSLRLNRFYALDLFVSKTRVILASIKAVSIGLGLTTLFFYVFSITNINRSLLVGFFGIFFAYHITKEIVYRYALVHLRYKRKPLSGLIVCAPEHVSERMAEVQHHELTSVQVERVCLTRGGREDLPEMWRDRFVGNLEDLSQAISSYSPDVVFLNDRGHADLSAQEVIEIAEEQGVEVWYFAEFLEPLLARPDFDEFGGEPVIVFSTVPHYEGRFLFKRLLDLFGATFILAVLSPFFAMIALGIMLTSRGDRSILYRQQRTGWRGKAFTIYKFRTMCEEADSMMDAVVEQNELNGPAFKSKEDPRLTAFGRWLRRFSLDELPQLWNVIRGEMSLVGPRPLPVYETEKFQVFRDRRRLSVLPGMTGLWQVSGRNELKNFSEWVRLDLEYIDKWSFWLDLRILAKTIPVVILGQGAS